MAECLNFSNALSELRQPFHCNIRITNKCNFSCLHCYQTPCGQVADKNELNLHQWRQVLDILKDKKVFSLTFTGGEIFTKKEFLKIYEYAYDNLFKIRLLTNLSLLDDEIINLLSRKKPISISTTLYGFSEQTYLIFTKNNMFVRVINNIEKLKNAGIKIKVKIIANIKNKNELVEMEKYFYKKSIDRFYYFKIYNFTNGDSSAKKLQLDNKFIEIFKERINFYKEFKEFYTKNKTVQFNKCNVGNTFFSIDSSGNVFLCEMQQNTLGNILKDGFDTCWNNLYIARKKHIEIDLGCKDCSYKKFCTYCAPKLKSEYGIPYKNRAACRSIKEFYQRMYEVDDINR